MRILKSLLLSLAFAIIAFAIIGAFPSKTFAVSASQWNAGNIIDDSVFYDSSSMSVDDIQNFLNRLVPSCDTNGTARNSNNSSLTNAQYASTQGWPGPPYVCLRNYYQVPRSDAIVDNFSGSIPSGAQSSAQIIKSAATQWGVSPKVIITTLQKESVNLLNDSWPLQSQYKNAMGYGCPDTAPCDPAYAGFYNQVNNAARQFKLYHDNPSQYNYKPFTTKSIYFNPTASCGSSNVAIQNYATAGLYNYTPYQPNQAALNNLYGLGDGCSAYGNRNFWRIYNDWFGSTSDPLGNGDAQLSQSIAISPAQPAQNQSYTISYTITNTSPNPLYIGSPFVAVRGPQGQNLDVPADNNVTIPGNGTYTFSKKWFSPYAGQHSFSVVVYKPGYGTSSTSPASKDSSVNRSISVNLLSNPRITSSLSISPSQPVINSPYTATFTVRNDSDSAVDLGYPFVVVRGPQGQNLDIGISGERVNIPANGSYTYSKQWSSPYAGQHSFSVATWIPEKGILLNYPVAGPNASSSVTAQVNDNPLLTQGLQVDKVSSSSNIYTVSYKVTNSLPNPVNIGSLFVAVRGPQGQNLDVPADNNVTIPGNGTYTFSKKWFSPYAGQHSFSVVVYKPGYGTSSTSPASKDSSVNRSISVNLLSNPRITSSLSISPSQPVINSPYTATFTVRNDSDSAVDLGYPFVVVRGPQGQNLDIGISGERVNIPANGSYTYSKQWSSPYAGQHSFSVATWIPEKGILLNYPVADSDKTISLTTQITR